MAATTLNTVSLTSKVAFDWATAEHVNSAAKKAIKRLRRVLLRRSSWGDSGGDSRLPVYGEVNAGRKSRIAVTLADSALYPLTWIFENARIARPAVGRPKLVAGRNVAKISMFFSSERTAAPLSPPERMR